MRVLVYLFPGGDGGNGGGWFRAYHDGRELGLFSAVSDWSFVCFAVSHVASASEGGFLWVVVGRVMRLGGASRLLMYRSCSELGEKWTPRCEE